MEARRLLVPVVERGAHPLALAAQVTERPVEQVADVGEDHERRVAASGVVRRELGRRVLEELAAAVRQRGDDLPHPGAIVHT